MFNVLYTCTCILGFIQDCLLRGQIDQSKAYSYEGVGNLPGSPPILNTGTCAHVHVYACVCRCVTCIERTTYSY